MGPRLRVLIGAWVLAALTLVAAGPVRAQFYEDARRSLDLSPDPAERSPRMLGMGRLSYVIDDVHHRSDVWEFSGNPAGLLDSDSLSTLELYPATSAANRVHDDIATGGAREQQEFALREVRLGYEGWHRAPGETAFGLIGDFGRLRTDLPASAATERRQQFSVPNTAVVLAGRLSSLAPDRLRYGVQVHHHYQTSEQKYRAIVSMPTGDYIDKDGVTLTPPDLLTPLDFSIRSLGFTTGALYTFAPSAKLGADFDYTSNAIEGLNEGARNSSEVQSDRTYRTGAGTLSGRVTLPGEASADYIAEYARWGTGRTDERWFITLSRGTGQTPFSGRGQLQSRSEKGNTLRTRIQVTRGPITLGFAASRLERTIHFRPPPDDPNAFNVFLRMLAGRPEVDSLVLPDSVVANDSKETRDEFGGGIAVRLPWRSSTVGVEYRQDEGELKQTRSGDGPQPRVREIRIGAEAAATRVLVVRAGYNDRSEDQDRLTRGSEFVVRTVSTGFALHPPQSAWTIETGYGVGWGRADFGDPTRIRSSRQQGIFRLRWGF